MHNKKNALPCLLTACFMLTSLAACATQPSRNTRPLAPNGKPYNVLFLAVDDLNDWIGCMGGHPQARTPHLDRLAERAVVFTNAHCQAPICNPSRISLLTGVLPSSSGVYYLGPHIRKCEATRRAVTIPRHFQRSGYHSWGTGKIFHVEGRGEFGEYGGSFGGFGPRPKKPIVAGHTHPLWDWGAFPQRDAQMPDCKLADWTVGKLSQQRGGGKPFFLACGFYRPHVPMYVPQKWFDLYPLDTVQLPAHLTDDLADIPRYGQDLTWSVVAPRHQWLLARNQWAHAVQSYLACVSFVDAQVGKVLDGLEKSGEKDNTIIVVWSDHGFHLGTKERWGKRSLWEDSTRVVLMVSVPGMTRGARCNRPVGLIDLFPTLIDLCGLEQVTGLEGHSLAPLLAKPDAPWPWPALTTFGQHNHAVRSQNWRYIVYADGSEELYDRRNDPHEFKNLAGDARYKRIIETHRRWLPQINQPMAPGSVHCDARPGSAPDIDGPRKK